MKRLFWIILLGLILIGNIGGKGIVAYAADTLTGDEPYWFERNSIVAHAGGGFEGSTYTNSLDAMEYNYGKGIRVFEVDMIFSSDCKLVCRHDWGVGAYNRFKQLYNRMEPIMSAERFKNTLIMGKYKSMTATDLVMFIKKHPDCYIVTDFKHGNSFVYRSSVRALVKEIQKVDPLLVDRIIWQIYSKENLADLKKVYKVNTDHIIFCLYMKPLKYTGEEILSWMLMNDIRVLGLSEAFYKQDKALVKHLLDNRIKTYLFTINDRATYEEMKLNYVFGIYTDNLLGQKAGRK